MKLIRVTVRWPDGLHQRAASELVQLARRFRAQILLQLGARIADTQSVLSMLTLAAGKGAWLKVIVCGGDEDEACVALQDFFQRPAFDDGLGQRGAQPTRSFSRSGQQPRLAHAASYPASYTNSRMIWASPGSS